MRIRFITSAEEAQELVILELVEDDNGVVVKQVNGDGLFFARFDEYGITLYNGLGEKFPVDKNGYLKVTHS